MNKWMVYGGGRSWFSLVFLRLWKFQIVWNCAINRKRGWRGIRWIVWLWLLFAWVSCPSFVYEKFVFVFFSERSNVRLVSFECFKTWFTSRNICAGKEKEQEGKKWLLICVFIVRLIKNALLLAYFESVLNAQIVYGKSSFYRMADDSLNSIKSFYLWRFQNNSDCTSPS